MAFFHAKYSLHISCLFEYVVIAHGSEADKAESVYIEQCIAEGTKKIETNQLHILKEGSDEQV